MKRFLALVSFAVAMSGAASAQDDRPRVWLGPEVTLQTTMGDIVVTLDPIGAPKTVKQFLGLTRAGYFDGIAVYRIEPGFVIQLGDLDAKLEYREPPLPAVPLETAGNKHEYLAVAMARADEPGSGRATFYIDMGANAHLNAIEGAAPDTTGYAVFGHVTKGWEVAEAIQKVELAPEGGPFPGHLPKVAVLVNKAVVTREWMGL